MADPDSPAAFSALTRAPQALLRRTANTRLGRVAWNCLRRWIDGEHLTNLDRRLSFFYERTPPEEWKMLTQAWDDSTPLPPGTLETLNPQSPRLAELAGRYAAVDLPGARPWQWQEQRLGSELDLAHFRGDSPFVWQYRDLPRATRLKFFIAAQYTRSRDTEGLLERLGEDGAFGAWTYNYAGLPPVSRDLLDSVNDLLFLDRHMSLLTRPGLRILDIGAGYGRLAWRTVQAADGLADYCCTDAIPQSTLLCEYYLRHRGALPPARVVPLDEIDAALAGARFDLVINTHSFSECTLGAIAWWFERIASLRAPWLYIVPNEPAEFLSTEADGSRRDFLPLVERAGYELAQREPRYDDAAVRELMNVADHLHLFRLKP